MPAASKTQEAHVQDELRHIGGEVTVEVIRDSGRGPEVIQRRVMKNLIVLSGKKQLLRLGSGLQSKFFDQFRIGTSAATPTSNQTNVLSPIANTRKTADSRTLLAGTRTHEWVISYPSGGGSLTVNDISEVVLLNEHTTPGGSALMRALVSPTVNKTTADKLKLTYRLRVV